MPVADKAEVKAEEVPSAQDEQGEKVEKVAETETFTGFQQPEAKGEQVGDLLTNGINAKTEEPLP